MDFNPLEGLFGGEPTPTPERQTSEIPVAAPVEAAEAAPATEAPDGNAAPSAASERPRDGSGKFVKAAPAEDANKPASEAGETQKPLTKAELDGMLSGMLAERDKRQVAERERDKFREELETFRAQNAPKPADEPYVDEGVRALMERQAAQVRAQALSERFNMSEAFLRSSKGDEYVDKVKAWGVEERGRNPTFAQELSANPHPYDLAAKRYEETQLRSQMTPDRIEAFLKWQAEQANPQPAPEAATPPANPSPAPPTREAPPAPRPSAASAPSAGGVASSPVGDGVAFGAIFK